MFKCIYKSLFLFFQMVGDDDVQDGIAESVVEISCGTLNDDLNLSDSSDDDENTRVNRLSNERPAPAPVTPDRTASPAQSATRRRVVKRVPMDRAWLVADAHHIVHSVNTSRAA